MTYARRNPLGSWTNRERKERVTHEINSLDLYERGILELHALLATGRGEAPEADALRDSLARFWHSLPDDQRDLYDGLTADLYMVSQNEVFLPSSQTSETSIPSLRRMVAQAFEGKDFTRCLQLLRSRAGIIPPYKAAFVRGRCCQHLGLHHFAWTFLNHAAQLDPDNESTRYLALDALRRTGNITASLTQAVVAARDSKRSPKVGFAACSILADVAARSDRETADGLYLLISDSLSKAIPVLSRTASKRADKTVLVASHILLGFSLTHLGHIKKALGHFKLATEVRKSDATAWTALGLHRFQHGISGAEPDLAQAVKLGEVLVWPYMVLALIRLRAGDFESAYDLSKMALDRSRSSENRQIIGEIMERARTPNLRGAAEWGTSLDNLGKRVQSRLAATANNEIEEASRRTGTHDLA